MAAIGLDVGTSGAKALLVDGAGRVLARASGSYAVTSPEAGCLGLAAAGWAAVHGADPAATAAAWARTTAVVEPRAAHRQAHAERFAAYRALYGALAGLAAPRAAAGSAQP